MGWTTPSTWVAGAALTAAQLNAQLRDNMLAVTPALAVMYYNGTSAPSGYTEATAVRGRVIVGLVASGTNGGTLGTALTDLQNNSHSHAITYNGWSHDGSGSNGVDGVIVIAAGTSGLPSQTSNATASKTSGGQNGMPYIQYLAVVKS